MRRIYVVFSTEIWKRRNIFRWTLNKCEIFSGKFWKRKNIFRQNMKEEKYFQVTCERWEIFSSKMWKRRNTMAAVGVEEEDGEQGERAKDIGLNRRRLHLLLNIGEHLLTKHCKTSISQVSVAKQLFCRSCYSWSRCDRWNIDGLAFMLPAQN